MKDNKNQFKNVRVLKKNMIFVQSYDDDITQQMLNNSAAYSVCGTVTSLKTKQNYKNVIAYITFTDCQAAAVALIAFYNLGSRVKVLFGTVQYCKYFMRKAECRNDYCVFLHVRDKKNQIIVNDQISEDVYQDHYDMAMDILQQNEYRLIKTILTSTSYKDAESLVKQGLTKAYQILKLEDNKSDKQQPLSAPTELKSVELTLQSTQQSVIVQTAAEQSSQQQNRKVSKANLPQAQNKQVNNFSFGDYIKIRLIKKLVRENSSKFHREEDKNSEQTKQINKRGKMILYQIVKN